MMIFEYPIYNDLSWELAGAGFSPDFIQSKPIL